VSGISRPSDLAVCRLMNSTLGDCETGRSAAVCSVLFRVGASILAGGAISAQHRDGRLVLRSDRRLGRLRGYRFFDPLEIGVDQR
jgi:hypothetical protein